MSEVGAERIAIAALVFSALFPASSVAARESDEIVLDAFYDRAPTDWCSRSRGLAVFVKMDGPDIIKGPRNLPKPVRERVGGQLRSASESPEAVYLGSDAEIDTDVVGHFSAEFGACYDPQSLTTRVHGNWRVTRNDDSVVDSGQIKDVAVSSSTLAPFFRTAAGLPQVQYVKFGDRILFTSVSPRLRNSHHFPPELDEE